MGGLVSGARRAGPVVALGPTELFPFLPDPPGSRLWHGSPGAIGRSGRVGAPGKGVDPELKGGFSGGEGRCWPPQP